MNRYIIHYKDSMGIDYQSDSIIDRDEVSARKTFMDQCKKCNLLARIVSVELKSENVSATKQQERDALAKIRQIVADLGPKSHLSIAFEGCFEDAENNIDHGAAHSMKFRWEESQKALYEAKGYNQNLEMGVEKLEREISRLSADNDCIRRKLHDYNVTLDDLREIIKILDDQILYTSESMGNAGGDIIDNAEDPASEAFLNAVATHRSLRSEFQRVQGLRNRLKKTYDDMIEASSS